MILLKWHLRDTPDEILYIIEWKDQESAKHFL